MLRKLVSTATVGKGLNLLQANMASVASRTIDYNQLKKLIDEKCIHLIDVREKQELAETGVLTNSVNVPLGEVESAFKMSNEEFEKKYQFSKPKPEEKIVFSCKAGGRSAKAMQAVLQLGYENVLNYGGGWLDWEKHLKGQS